MAQVKARIVVGRRWFFWPALIIASVVGRLGLIRDLDNGRGVVITGQERVTKWLVDHAFRFEVR